MTGRLQQYRRLKRQRERLQQNRQRRRRQSKRQRRRTQQQQPWKRILNQLWSWRTSATSSRGSEVKDGGFNAETKTVESEISAHDGEDKDTSPTVKVMPWVGAPIRSPMTPPGSIA